MDTGAPRNLFRPEVMEARRDRLHGDVSIAIPVSWQAIGYLLFASLIAALIFLGAASYSRVETVSGAIVVDRGTAAIIPTRPGVIVGLSVQEGERVAAGQQLLHIRAEEDMASGGTAPKRMLDALQEQDRQLGSQRALALDAASADRSRLAAIIAGAEQEITTLDQQIVGQRRLVALAEDEFSDAQEIATKGFLSRRDLDSREASLLARRQQLAQLQQVRAAKLADVVGARGSMAQSGATAQAQAVAVQSQRSQLAQQMAQAESAQGYTLTSPVNGTVTALTARLGQPATQGQPLMVIMPDGARRRVELHVPTSAAGFLAKGQEVRLTVDAFPYQRFGTVSARISEISTTTVEKAPTDRDPRPIYLVTAELARPSVHAFGRAQPLLPGMTVTGRIVIQKQSLFEWLFEPLFAVGRR